MTIDSAERALFIADMADSIVVGKLDAARRQLETAIGLYFDYGDPVSIHTLCAAGYNIVHAMKKAKAPGEVMLKDLGRFLDTDAAREFQKRVNEPENFFKHAARDPGHTLTFSRKETEVLLMDATRSYMALTGERPRLFEAYFVWFIVQHPNVFMSEPTAAKVLRNVDVSVMGNDRREFFRTCSIV